jgi:hypothetical protein
MTEFEQQLAKVDKRIERVRKRFADLNAERNAILANCPHDRIERKDHYYSGDYLNTSYTEHWNQCAVCGAKSEVTIENHGSYA